MAHRCQWQPSIGPQNDIPLLAKLRRGLLYLILAWLRFVFFLSDCVKPLEEGVKPLEGEPLQEDVKPLKEEPLEEGVKPLKEEPLKEGVLPLK